ncbi:MAG: recombinase family protein [Microbacterium sp.]
MSTEPTAHEAADCPDCFEELTADHEFWQVRPVGSRLVGLVVHRDGMPSVTQQREDLTRFGVPIAGFRHPAPDVMESWQDRLARLFDRLTSGDVLVVTSVHALGRDASEETRTIQGLAKHGVVVKVLEHGKTHLADA